MQLLAQEPRAWYHLYGMVDTGDAVTYPKNAGVTVSSCFKAEGSSSVGELEKSLIYRKDDK